MSNTTEETERIPTAASASVQISPDRRSASLLLKEPEPGGKELTEEDLQAVIAKVGVVFGIRENAIRQLVTNPVYGMAIPFAEGEEPVHGIDGYVEYHFATELVKAPTARADGTVDYKELLQLPNVRKGDVLCTQHKPIPGTPGKTVQGKEIPPRTGRTIPLPIGKNTVISGEQLLANTDGQACVVAKKVSVLTTFTVPGDVDLGTGNITFYGNVEVQGTIRDGFIVKADGFVMVKGSVEGGIIEATGDVRVGEGIIGGEHGSITCGGNLISKHVHNGHLNVGGDVETTTIYHSDIVCGGRLRMPGSHAALVGGKTVVRNSLDVCDLGSRLNDAETYIEVGSDPKAAKRNEQIPLEEKAIQKQQDDIERLVAVLKGLHDAGRLDANREDEYTRILATKDALERKHFDLIRERGELIRIMVTSGYGTCNIRGIAYPGVRIVMGADSVKLADEVTFTCYVRTPEKGLHTSPAKGQN